MKTGRFHILPGRGAALALSALLFGGLQAQPATQGALRLQLDIEDESGERTRLDTLIELGSGADLDALLERFGVNADLDLDGPGEDVEIIINKTRRGDGEADRLRLELNELVPDLRGLQDALRDVQERVMVFESEQGSPRAFLGIYFDAAQADGPAVRVTEVIEGTGAEAAGLREGDLILGMDGQRFSEEEGIRLALAGRSPGETVALHVEREGQPMELRATLGEPREAAAFRWLGDDEDYEFRWDEGDLDLGQLRFRPDPEEWEAMAEKPFLGVLLNYSEGDAVRISGTVDGSTARAMGLKSGDLITSVNGQAVTSVASLQEAVAALTIGEPVRVGYRREGTDGVAEGTLLPRTPAANGYLFREGLQDAMRDVERLIEEKVIREGEALPEDLLRDLEELRSMEDLDIFFGGDDLEGLDTRVVRRVSVFITMDRPSAEELERLEEASGTELPTGDDLDLGNVYFSPNPSNGRFELHFDLTVAGPVTVRLYDAAGRPVYENVFEGEPGRHVETVDAAGEPQGVYYLAVTQGERGYTRKVVIQ